ncbi:bifunctional non-homologous end joining protein LigD [Paraburkholderia sp. JPY465]|uniref:ATP-dependent DNA ligase n=1 Tax=Paraburkholderia sp. JPY465 TaxID=3042285 RepID=UPI003D1D85FD
MSLRAVAIERQHRRRCLFKYDGYRCLVKKSGETVELVSRNGKALNDSFPDVADAVRQVPGDFVWDSELTVDDRAGHSDFERLQQRARTRIPLRVHAAARESPARLYVFDMLARAERDMRAPPLEVRKQRLRDSFENSAVLVYASGIVGAGEWVWEQVISHAFEGMVAKRLASPYEGRRSPDWLKIKNPDYGRPAALSWARRYARLDRSPACQQCSLGSIPYPVQIVTHSLLR